MRWWAARLFTKHGFLMGIQDSLRPEHLRRRRLTYLARRAIGDLFAGPYVP